MEKTPEVIKSNLFFYSSVTNSVCLLFSGNKPKGSIYVSILNIFKSSVGVLRKICINTIQAGVLYCVVLPCTVLLPVRIHHNSICHQNQHLLVFSGTAFLTIKVLSSAESTAHLHPSLQGSLFLEIINNWIVIFS